MPLDTNYKRISSIHWRNWWLFVWAWISTDCLISSWWLKDLFLFFWR